MTIYTKPTLVPELASGTIPIYAWAASTAYTANTFVALGGAIYRCTVDGTSASSGGPSGTGSAIVDGTATWAYSRPALGAGPAVEPSATQKSLGLTQSLLADGSSFGVLNYLWQLTRLWVLYLSSLALQSFTWKRQHTFGQTLTATNANTAWATSTAYAVDDIRSNDTNKVYICTVAGTSAGSGGPTGTGAAIVDGTVTWKYVRGLSPALQGTSAVSGQAGVRGVGDGTGAAPAMATADVLQFEALASDPSAPVEGQVWYNSTSHAWKGRKNGNTVTFTTS